MTVRRELTTAVLAVAAGAGLALYAGTRDWAVRLTERPAPLSPVRETYTGAEFASWLPAVALVALAAGVALYATRGTARLIVGVVTAGCGLALAGAGAYGLAVAGEAGRTVLAAGTWPLLCTAGGIAVTGAGVFTVVRGRRWPAMGARYEREAPAAVPAADAEPAQLWDALDSGADPTERG